MEKVNYARNLSMGLSLREALLADIYMDIYIYFGLRIVWTRTVRRCNAELIQDYIFHFALSD